MLQVRLLVEDLLKGKDRSFVCVRLAFLRETRVHCNRLMIERMGDARPDSPDPGSRLTASCPGCPLCTAQLRESQNLDWAFSGRDSGELGEVGVHGDGTTALRQTFSEPNPLHSVSFTETGSRPSQFAKRPRRIILVRHGQSEGNVDASVYTREADWRVPLTEQGFREAEEAGRRIRELIERSHAAEAADEGTEWACFFYVSPYTRTLQVRPDTTPACA